MTHLFKHQPLLEILAKVSDYYDLVNLSQIEKRFLLALEIRHHKLIIIQRWAKRTFEKSSIKKITLTLIELTNLTHLVLPFQRITKIPPEIGQLTQQHSCNLELLYLYGNRISEIPPALKTSKLKIYI